MDDQQIVERINELAHQEHALWEAESKGEASDGERERLQELQVTSTSAGTSSTSAELGAPRGWIPTTRASVTPGRWRDISADSNWRGRRAGGSALL